MGAGRCPVYRGIGVSPDARWFSVCTRRTTRLEIEKQNLRKTSCRLHFFRNSNRKFSDGIGKVAKLAPPQSDDELSLFGHSLPTAAFRLFSNSFMEPLWNGKRLSEPGAMKAAAAAAAAAAAEALEESPAQCGHEYSLSAAASATPHR